MAENASDDNECLRSMLAAIEAYRAGSITLRDLTEQLDAHYWPLLGRPAEWRRQLRSQWIALEEVRMVSLSRGQWQIESYCRAVIERTMPSIASLIQDALGAANQGGSPVQPR